MSIDIKTKTGSQKSLAYLKDHLDKVGISIIEENDVLTFEIDEEKYERQVNRRTKSGYAHYDSKPGNTFKPIQIYMEEIGTYDNVTMEYMDMLLKMYDHVAIYRDILNISKASFYRRLTRMQEYKALNKHLEYEYF